MKIDFILFHSQLRSLLDPATGKFRLIMGKKGVTGQLMSLYFTPGAAFLALGLISACRNPYLGHGCISISLKG